MKLAEYLQEIREAAAFSAKVSVHQFKGRRMDMLGWCEQELDNFATNDIPKLLAIIEAQRKHEREVKQAWEAYFLPDIGPPGSEDKHDLFNEFVATINKPNVEARFEKGEI